MEDLLTSNLKIMLYYGSNSRVGWGDSSVESDQSHFGKVTSKTQVVPKALKFVIGELDRKSVV